MLHTQRVVLATGDFNMVHIVYNKKSLNISRIETSPTPPLENDIEGVYSHAQDLVYPNAPGPWAVLKLVNGEMVWHDKRTTEEQWADMRLKRVRLLSQTDWVVTKALELNQPVPAAWLEYRQALRDVTLEPNPLCITWPAMPA